MSNGSILFVKYISSYTICVRPEAGYDCVQWQVSCLSNVRSYPVQARDIFTKYTYAYFRFVPINHVAQLLLQEVGIHSLLRVMPHLSIPVQHSVLA